MHQIDYKLNAIHGLKMLSKHGDLQGHEKVITEYVIKVLEKQVSISGVAESYGAGDYGMHTHNLSIEGYGVLKKICSHDWEYVGHTHNMKHYKCRHCGAEKEE